MPMPGHVLLQACLCGLWSLCKCNEHLIMFGHFLLACAFSTQHLFMLGKHLQNRLSQLPSLPAAPVCPVSFSGSSKPPFPLFSCF